MWVARDIDGSLCEYNTKPFRENGSWELSGFGLVELDNNLYPDLKWEDEPIEVGNNNRGINKMKKCPLCDSKLEEEIISSKKNNMEIVKNKCIKCSFSITSPVKQDK